MNILLSTYGSSGDVHPFVGLAIALKNRGHKVTIITNPYFKTLVQSLDLEFIGLGSAQDYLAAVENPDIWNPRKGFQIVAKGGVLPIMRPLYELISNYDPKKTTIVTSTFCIGARIAQEKNKFPLATIHLQPSIIRTYCEAPVFPGVKLPQNLPKFAVKLLYNAVDFLILDPVIRPEVNEFRKELGLAPVRHILGNWLHSPNKVIGLFPDWFAQIQPDWPQNTELTGFINFDASKEKEKLSTEIADFIGDDKQALVFTPGTAMKYGKEFFKTSVKIAEKLGRKALLLSKFTLHIPDKLPPTIKHVEYIPFSLVLPKIAALIHHGGIGTSAQALASGIPQLVMPINHDQPDNATRLEKLGVASFIYPENYTVETGSKKLTYLLNSPEVLAKCQNFQKKIDFNKAINDTCKIIEEFSK